ncbi:MAG: VOC family protein [Leadbetterella sp.]|nr:VOC family protein [Leadbetterella sp.]
MKNLVSIIEIPVNDLGRASAFYQAVLQVTIEEMEMDGSQLGVFPAGEGTVNLVLIKGEGYEPSSAGVLIYLNAGDDLGPVLDRIEEQGGTVVVPRTLIDPEMGYFAVFTDTEGNKLGLHSIG